MTEQSSLSDISDESNSNSAEKKRRPEIKGKAEDWQVIDLQDIVEIKGGGTPSKSNEEYWNGEIPWASVKDLTELTNLWKTETQDYITKKGLEQSSSNLIPENSVIISTRMTVGEPFINLEKMSINQDLKGLIPDTEKVNPGFLLYALWGKDNFLKSLGRGTTVSGITTRDLERLGIALPELDEQRRIASVLYNVDKAIQKTEEIIEQTQRVKKGLMQDLFTEGYYSHEEFEETRLGPRKLEIPKDWSVEKISDFADIKGGKRLPKSHSYAKDETDYPYLRVKDFKGGSIDQDKLKYLKPKTREKISRYTISSDDVYISIAGTLGIAGTIPNNLDGANLTENAAKITNIECVDKEYLALYLQSNFGQKEVHRFTVGSTQPKLSIFRIRKMEGLVPPREEQEKIVQAINSVESKKEIFKEEKDQLQRLKKGLMQDLLTGGVRTGEDVEVLDEVVEVED